MYLNIFGASFFQKNYLFAGELSEFRNSLPPALALNRRIHNTNPFERLGLGFTNLNTPENRQ